MEKNKYEYKLELKKKDKCKCECKLELEKLKDKYEELKRLFQEVYKQHYGIYKIV